MPETYTEPNLAIAVLDFAKPVETYMCLRSIRQFVKVPHTVVLCDNGSRENYFLQFLDEKLVDQVIINRDSRGLGLGTRDLFSLIHAKWTLYLQNDQLFFRDFADEHFNALTCILSDNKTMSVSLAGAPCGENTYSERAHLISTEFYKHMEKTLPLGYHGAGKYHDGVWRERQIQDYYKGNSFNHCTYISPYVADNGVFAVREMGEGGLWCHRTDTKKAWCIRPPHARHPVYPKLTNAEYDLAATGNWPREGAIPEIERADSFDCWSQTPLGKIEQQYVDDLRRRKQ